MAAKTFSTFKVETEGDLNVLYGTILTVTDGDTIDISGFFKGILGIGINSSTKTPFGSTTSAGVVTFKSDTTSSAGAATLTVRFAGN